MRSLQKNIKYQRVAKLLDGPWPKTKLIDEFEPEVQGWLTQTIRKLDAGNPIAAFFEGPETWTILTTTHLAWSVPGEGARALSFDRIHGTDFHPQDVARIIKDNSFKARVNRVQLTSVEGQTWTLRLESDVPLYKFWSAIKILTQSSFGLKRNNFD